MHVTRDTHHFMYIQPGRRACKAMRRYLLVVLFLSLTSFCFGQAPSARPSPSAPPERRRDFGSSLRRYERRQRRDAPDKRKGDDPGEEEVVRVETDMVVDDVLVTNQKGDLIIGLRKDDFVVRPCSPRRSASLRRRSHWKRSLSGAA